MAAIRALSDNGGKEEWVVCRNGHSEAQREDECTGPNSIEMTATLGRVSTAQSPGEM